MNKSSKETRMGRLEKRSTFKLDSVYYKIIAGLVAILVGLIIFIIWQKSSSTDDYAGNENKNSEEETVIKEDNQKEEKDSEKEEQPSTNIEEKPQENNNGSNKEQETNNEVVTPDAPLDKTHETSYEEGSKDMVAIIELSKKATGLGEDMYPVWIGNNGPGKVQATVSNKDNSKQFVVDLQFGEGAWHVTNVEQIEE